MQYLETTSVSQYRLETTFDCTKTSRRLLMFQVAFLQMVYGEKKSNNNNNNNNASPPAPSIRQLVERYNGSYGYPSAGQAERLQEICKQIFEVNRWRGFYQRLGLSAPSDQELTSTLRQVISSFLFLFLFPFSVYSYLIFILIFLYLCLLGCC